MSNHLPLKENLAALVCKRSLLKAASPFCIIPYGYFFRRSRITARTSGNAGHVTGFIVSVIFFSVFAYTPLYYNLNAQFFNIFTDCHMICRRIARQQVFYCLFLFLIALSSAPGEVRSQAGGSPTAGQQSLDSRLQTLESRLQKQAAQVSVAGSGMALEGSINPEEYIMGPGDVFQVTVDGILPLSYAVTISVAGDIVLPEVGTIPAAGRTLAAVKDDALRELKKQYANVNIGMALIQPRMFYVHLSGAVPMPGRYLMMPVSRINDAVYEAYFSETIGNQAEKKEALGRPTIQQEYKPALRNILVTHLDGSQESIDLIRYHITGNIEHNPYLQDGDVIMIPAYHANRDGIRISGDVAFPGIYDMKPDDTLVDFLSLVSGSDRLDSSAEINLARSDSDGKPVHVSYDVQRLLDGEDAPIPLRAGDHLTVHRKTPTTAAIQGLVVYPGTYRIKEGETTLRELVELAGGLKADANVRNAFLERRKSLDFRESGRASNLDFFSRYYAQSFAQGGAIRVNVDIEAALQSDSASVTLYDGDRLVFPRDENTVHVYGHVLRPGFVAFEEGRTAAHYITLTGGRGTYSRKTYVFDGSSGEVHVGDHHIVDSGDTVFVDRTDVAETPEIAQLLLAEQQNKRLVRIQTTQVIVAGVTAITGIVTTAIALFR